MSRLHTNWSRSLLRNKPSVRNEQEEGKVLTSAGGLDVLKSLEVAENTLVPIKGLIYTFDVKDGRRINQRFYSRGAKMVIPPEKFKRDIVFDIRPIFPDGHIVPLKRFHSGELVVSVPDTTNVFKFKYNNPESPQTSSVTVEFIITPTFVSFDGLKAVDPNAKNDPDESEEE